MTLLPALLLILLQVMFSGSFDFLRHNLFLIPAIVLASLCACSSRRSRCSRSRRSRRAARYVAIIYTGAIFFTEAIFGVCWSCHRIDACRVGLDRRRISST